MVYTLKNEYITLSVNSHGASMQSLIYLGEERMWQGGEFWSSHDVVIFPIVGHAGAYTAEGKTFTPKSHGVVRYADLEAVEVTDTSLTLQLLSNAVTRETYPYDFIFSINYTLVKNSVKITYTVKSVSGKIPFYVGGHPGMIAPGGEALISFEKVESPMLYPLNGEPVKLDRLEQFVANKDFFKQCKTLQLGSLSGGNIYARTRDGYVYAYSTNCPVVAFWSNENGGDYICVEPWWGINDFDGAPKELKDKPFINFADEAGSSFSYTLTVNKD